MEELEKTLNKSEEVLQDVNGKQREEQEYKKALNKAANKGRRHISRLMNPNISSEMER